MKSVIQPLCLSIIGLLLLGYVLGDKGFAHLGLPPIYVGEVVLLIAVALFLMAPRIQVFFESRAAWALMALCGWCLLRTIPYIETWGSDAFRDASLYGYSAFAFIIAACIIDTRSIERVCVIYGRVITVCIILMPALLRFQSGTVDPAGEDVPLIMLKSGDVAVHLVGALSFQLLGLRTTVMPAGGWVGKVVEWLFWAAVSITLVMVASATRGGFLALLCGLGVVAAFRFSRRSAVAFMAAATLLLTLFWALDIRVEGERRDISTTQIINNAVSMVTFDFDGGGDPATADLTGTARWRLMWWGDVVDYVIFGEYFWTGKGFGINLADDDLYQVDAEGRLRSPHNVHITVLARAGVPGLILWLLFLGAFAAMMIGMAGRMRRRGWTVWQRINLWIFSYWFAAIVNGTFDVYLEGPQGGICFWSITGMGLAVYTLERRALTETLSPEDRSAFPP